MKKVINKKQEEGITLVTVAVVVIVLLILAGITMSTLLGENSIIQKAKEAGDKYKNSAINEQDQLSAIEDILGEMGIPTGDIEFTIEPETSRNTAQGGEQNGIITGPIKVTIEYKKEKGLVREYAIQKIGQTGAIIWKTASTNPVILEITENVTILTRYRNIEQNTSQTIPLNIMNVDNIAPDVYSYEVTSTTTNSITVKAQTQDVANEGSGPNIAGIGKYQYSKDKGVTWEEDENPSNTSYTFTNLTQNQGYKIAVKAIDKAGNERVATNNGTMVTTTEIAGGNEENTGAITMTPSTANWTNQDVTVTANWPSNITGLTKEISIDNGTNWKKYTVAEIITQNTTVMARLKDSTGQASTKTALLNITNIDKLKPNEFRFTTSSTTNSITVTGSTTDQAQTTTNGSSGIKGYQYSINNGEWTALTTNTTNTFANLTQGQSYTIKMKAIDNAGNEIESNNTGSSVTIGTIPGGDGGNSGLINIVVSNSNWTNQNVTVTVNWPSNIEGLTKLISTDGGVNFHTYTGAETISQNTTVMARLKDSTGQVSNKTATLSITNIDKTVPSIPTLTNDSSGNWTKNNVTIIATASDIQSGIVRIEYSYNQSNWATDVTLDNIGNNNWRATGIWSGERNNTTYFRAVDAAGNISNVSSTIIKIDKTGPTITAVDTGTKTDSTITVKVTGAHDTGMGSIAGYQYYSSNTGSWGGTEGNSKQYTGLSASTQYSFYVRAIDNLGNMGGQVGPYNVITNAPPIQPLINRVELGDYVNYSANGYSYAEEANPNTNANSTKKGWRVLKKNTSTGEVTIISAGSVESLTLSGLNGYNALLTSLNNASSKYYNGTYAKGNTIPNIRSAGTTATGALDNPSYGADPEDVKIMKNAGVVNSTSATPVYCWLGSGYIGGYGDGLTRYSARATNLAGMAYYLNLYYSNGTSESHTNGIRPIIILKAETKTTGKDNNGVWQLTI